MAYEKAGVKVVIIKVFEYMVDKFRNKKVRHSGALVRRVVFPQKF
jgi:hypothetical protein